MFGAGVLGISCALTALVGTNGAGTYPQADRRIEPPAIVTGLGGPFDAIYTSSIAMVILAFSLFSLGLRENRRKASPFRAGYAP